MKKGTWARKESIKTIAICLVRTGIRLLYAFPVQSRRVFFFSFDGKRYSCNPRAISEYLMREYPGKYEVIWAFRDPEKYGFLREQGIKTVAIKSLKRLYLQVTSQVVINNSGSYSWNPVRKGQVHVNTWHAGGAYKRLQHDAGADYNRRLTAKETTHMISACEMFTKTNILEQFGFHGTVLKTGMPRNDVFFDQKKIWERNRDVRKQFEIPLDSMLILFAPTWRYDGEIPEPDYEAIQQWTREKWGKSTKIMVRSHNLSRKTYEGMLDVTAYEDMQDLLCAADILITDYSSSVWDYSFTGKPCFLFVPDLAKYTEEQGFYTDIHTWGFPVCENNEALREAILSFDPMEYQKKMEKHHQDLGSYEHGTAARQFCEEIFGKAGES